MHIQDKAALEEVDESQLQVLIDMGMMKCTHCKGLKEFVIDWILNRKVISTSTLICALSYVLNGKEKIQADRVKRLFEPLQSPRFVTRYSYKDIPRLLVDYLVGYAGLSSKNIYLQSLYKEDKYPRSSIEMIVQPTYSEVYIPFDDSAVPSIVDETRRAVFTTERYRCRTAPYSLYSGYEDEPLLDMVRELANLVLVGYRQTIRDKIIVWDWTDIHPLNTWSTVDTWSTVGALDIEIAVAM